ncbi:MAG: hypothetical protein EOL95_02905 [Bacteroidia bacterium]|nr:hypothetical protein [Bacteroidia bacterium]
MIKRYYYIVAISAVVLEIIMTIIHQLVLSYSYSLDYMIVPLFFISAEFIYCKFLGMEKKTMSWFMIFKTLKLLVSIVILGLFYFVINKSDFGLYIRFFVAYFVFLALETWIGLDYSKHKVR